MSQELLGRSKDLLKLRDEGYEIEIRSNYLIVHHVPYLDSNKAIQYGKLVSELTISGSQTVQPSTHVIYFIGGFPCQLDGSEISSLKGGVINRRLFGDVIVNCQFSNKPVETGKFPSYYEKVKHYADFISSIPRYKDPSVTAKTFKVIANESEDCVFHYPDTNSSRAGIVAVADHIKNQNIAIIGVGGTGSYILDFLAKTPVGAIHLFDEDRFRVHNAYRAPGAPSIPTLNKGMRKVDYLASIYSRMHKHIIPHGVNIDEANIQLIKDLDINFVFVSADLPSCKEVILTNLIKWEIPFVDVGMGIELVGESLIGTIRTTTGTTHNYKHIWDKDRVGFKGGEEDDEYADNIQIAELNALNASFAVIKWKKLYSFYLDDEKESHSTYTINTNYLDSDDHEA